ncbi:MAG: hypothetical protein R2684_09760 [Pyrinomonadaceae bacterium]
MATVATSWVARNLGSKMNIGFGNHHFIMIQPGGFAMPGGIEIKNAGGTDFLTLGAFNSDEGNMVFEANNESDVGAATEILTGSGLGRFLNPFDWGAQKHEVTPPHQGVAVFAVEVVQRALNYKRNTDSTPLKYTLSDDNCASWVNTLFKVVGVSAAERKRLGQFWGVDWAEQLEIPDHLFN